MEVTIVVLVVLAVGGLYGVGGYLLRDFGKQVLNRDSAVVGAGLQARQESALADARAELDRLNADLRTATTEGDAQLARLRQRREATQAELDAALAKAREELSRAERIRQGAEQAEEAERRAQTSVAAAPVVPAAPTERAQADAMLASRVAIELLETLTGLYARLARVETALAQLTTPILLPGEPYEAPEEFLPEALRWDNWKDVGETAYALGEHLTENRLRLTPATARELETGVTALRIALTRSIYPNLSPAPTEEQEAMLRTGLDVLAQTLPRMRGLLEADYRVLTGTGEGAEPKSPGAGRPSLDA